MDTCTGSHVMKKMPTAVFQNEFSNLEPIRVHLNVQGKGGLGSAQEASTAHLWA